VIGRTYQPSGEKDIKTDGLDAWEAGQKSPKIQSVLSNSNKVILAWTTSGSNLEEARECSQGRASPGAETSHRKKMGRQELEGG